MPASEDDNGEGASTPARPGAGFDETDDDFQDTLIKDAALSDKEDSLTDDNTDA